MIDIEGLGLQEPTEEFHVNVFEDIGGKARFEFKLPFSTTPLKKWEYLEVV